MHDDERINRILNPIPPGAGLFPADKEWFTINDAAVYIGRDRSTLHAHIRAGNIVANKEPITGTLILQRENLDQLYRLRCYKGMDK